MAQDELASAALIYGDAGKIKEAAIFNIPLLQIEDARGRDLSTHLQNRKPVIATVGIEANSLTGFGNLWQITLIVLIALLSLSFCLSVAMHCHLYYLRRNSNLGLLVDQQEQRQERLVTKELLNVLPIVKFHITKDGKSIRSGNRRFSVRSLSSMNSETKSVHTESGFKADSEPVPPLPRTHSDSVSLAISAQDTESAKDNDKTSVDTLSVHSSAVGPSEVDEITVAGLNIAKVEPSATNEEVPPSAVAIEVDTSNKPETCSEDSTPSTPVSSSFLPASRQARPGSPSSRPNLIERAKSWLARRRAGADPDAELESGTLPSVIPSIPIPKSFMNDTCPVCIEPFEDNEDLRMLPCQHVYHAECIDSWLTDRDPRCPMCMFDVIDWYEKEKEQKEQNGQEEPEDQSSEERSSEVPLS
ncbi:hypothetical protein BKA69DRAFT_123025 [Paraphysoderma sedebokerense]|nr:hypothetical protein BKA69DRAFT_123025 [Paraphysoderma sedebokerense]